MPSFPDLPPVSRKWSFPSYPVIDYENPDGSTRSFELGLSVSSQALELNYQTLYEDEMSLIREHYANQQQVYPFELSLSCLGGYTEQDAAEVFGSLTSWLYDKEPKEEPKSFGVYDITISFERNT